MTDAQNDNEQLQYCTFTVADLYLGIEVRRVQEVLRHQTMTPVPLAPREISGLINLRGQIVTAIDVRTRLGLPAAEGEYKPMSVIVRTEDGPVSLLVDEICDVLDVGESDAEAPPATLRAEDREVITRVYKLKDRLLLVLDVDKLMESAVAVA